MKNRNVLVAIVIMTIFTAGTLIGCNDKNNKSKNNSSITEKEYKEISKIKDEVMKSNQSLIEDNIELKKYIIELEKKIEAIKEGQEENDFELSENKDKNEDKDENESYYLKAPVKLYRDIIYGENYAARTSSAITEINYNINNEDSERVEVLEINEGKAKITITGYIPSWYITEEVSDSVKVEDEKSLYLVENSSMRMAPGKGQQVAQKLESGTAVKVLQSYEEWYYVSLILPWSTEIFNEGWIEKDKLVDVEALLNHRNIEIGKKDNNKLYENITVLIKNGAKDYDHRGNIISTYEHEDIGRVFGVSEINGARIFDIELPDGIFLSTEEKYIEFIK